MENSTLIGNDIIEDTNDSQNNNDGTLFKIDAEVSKLSNINITDNETENSLFYLKTGVGEVSNLAVSNNKSKQGIIFDAQTFTINDEYENYGTLKLENLIFENNEVENKSKSTFGTINIQRYNKVIASNNRFENNKTDGNGGAILMSLSGGAAVGIPANEPASFNDNGSSYINNSATNDGGALYFAGVNVDISSTSFENNSANQGSAIYFSTYSQNVDLNLNFHNVNMKDNDKTGGAVFIDIDKERFGYSKAVNVNIDADGRDIVWSNLTSNQVGNDLIVNFYGNQGDSTVNVNLSSKNKGSLSLLSGISSSRHYASSKGVLNINIGDAYYNESNVLLGGESSFDSLVTNFNVDSGNFTLLKDARLVWKNQVSDSYQETGKFFVADRSSFSVYLNKVSEDNVAQHIDLAPIDLGGNTFTMEEGSNLNISINNVEALKDSSEEGWLVVAANAKLTEESNPNIVFKDDNWLYDFSEDQKLQQGMSISDSQDVVQGTEDNIYVGYKISQEIHPDQDAVKLSNATSHFAASSIRSISNAVTNYYRPKHANTLWVLPQYIHDNRDTDDLGVGFDAQLRAITVGNDFIFDNGYWGFGIGYGDGNIHSNGGIAYTNGDIQSVWGIGYFKYIGEKFNIYADAAYLYQDADQEQRNIVGPLYTNTTNDVFLANLGISKDIVLSKDDSSQWSLSPSLGVEYIYLGQRDFDVNLENGATVLHGDDDNMNMFTIPLEATLQYDLAHNDLRHNFHLTLGASKNVGDKSMSGDYTDINGNNADKWTLIPVDDYQGKVGFGYTLYSLEEDISVDLGVNYVFSNSRELTDVVGTIKYNW